MGTSSSNLFDALRRRRDPAELAKVRTRRASTEEAIGLPMRDVFDVARAHRDLPLDEVGALLDHPAYEPRLTPFCILDFKARRRTTEDERRALCEMYLRRHNCITTWDMVDRAAPHVVGGHLAGRSLTILHQLAASPNPLERRTAITAPLFFVKRGSDEDITGAFEVAGLLADDPLPVVHNAVGIFLKHTGTRDPAAVDQFLERRASTMARAAVRLATEKLPAPVRDRYRADRTP